MGAAGAYASKVYVPVDVTSLVTASGPVSFAVKAVNSTTPRRSSRAGVERPGKPQLLESRQAAGGGGEETVVYALGDGADGSNTSRDLANYVIAQSPDRFFYLGDVYETGTATEFANNYEPLPGALGSITDPAIGNHEYGNRATGYYAYWMNKRGWTQEQAKHRSYVESASGWQIIAYSSETDMAAEGAWVAAEVAKHPGTCRIVIAREAATSSPTPPLRQHEPGVGLVGHQGQDGDQPRRPQPHLRPPRPGRRRNRLRLRRRRSRLALAGRAAPRSRRLEDGRRDRDAAGAADRRGRLRPGRQERDGL